MARSRTVAYGYGRLRRMESGPREPRPSPPQSDDLGL